MDELTKQKNKSNTTYDLFYENLKLVMEYISICYLNKVKSPTIVRR